METSLNGNISSNIAGLGDYFNTNKTQTLTEKYGLSAPVQNVSTFDTSKFNSADIGKTVSGFNLDAVKESPWYKDNSTLSTYAGLGSTLLQAMALPEQMKLAKVQRQSLEQNLAQAKEDSALQATARSNLNANLTNKGAGI